MVVTDRFDCIIICEGNFKLHVWSLITPTVPNEHTFLHDVGLGHYTTLAFGLDCKKDIAIWTSQTPRGIFTISGQTCITKTASIKENAMFGAFWLIYITRYHIPQTSSMRPPYGTCGESHLDLYDPGTFYSRSRCVQQCSTRMTASYCGCIDAYMPGTEGKTHWCWVFTGTCWQGPSWYNDFLSRYGDFYYKDKTIVRPYYLYLIEC